MLVGSRPCTGSVLQHCLEAAVMFVVLTTCRTCSACAADFAQSLLAPGWGGLVRVPHGKQRHGADAGIDRQQTSRYRDPHVVVAVADRPAHDCVQSWAIFIAVCLRPASAAVDVCGMRMDVAVDSVLAGGGQAAAFTAGVRSPAQCDVQPQHGTAVTRCPGVSGCAGSADAGTVPSRYTPHPGPMPCSVLD